MLAVQTMLLDEDSHLNINLNPLLDILRVELNHYQQSLLSLFVCSPSFRTREIKPVMRVKLEIVLAKQRLDVEAYLFR